MNSFLGGIWKRGPEGRRGQSPPPAEVIGEDWGWVGEGSELFLRGAPASARLFRWDSLVLLIRGHVRLRGSNGSLDLERVAEEIRCQYLEMGTLAVDDLDGSFTLALLDGQAERVLLYRNLIGTGFTYYRATSAGLLFGGNLVELIDTIEQRPMPNREALPSFFLYRAIPGRETLFAGVHRLMPGEEISWDHRGLRRTQRHTFADLRGTPSAQNFDDAIAGLENTLATVLADCAALRPGAVNLLSGGVDSSYLQAVWNRVPGAAPRTEAGHFIESVAIAVDHPHTWGDTDYAVSAATALGTRHRLVPADAPYAGYLIDTLASVGEPLNHVQSAYFGQLARVLAASGAPAGLCGEGADSLFGLGLTSKLQNAAVLRRLLPSRALRWMSGALLARTRCPLLAATCRLANRLDDMTDPEHPVNQVAAFTDDATLLSSFGGGAVLRAMASRRALVARMGVPETALERTHAAGFLGEAMDSAGLWANLFQRAGVDLLCPFLDSRLVRFALNLPDSIRFPFRRPKELLKRALERHVPRELARRSKLGFGQPIFEWLGLGGQLRPWVARLRDHDLVDRATLERLQRRPTWFLYSLLVYDLWHRLFIDRSLDRPTHTPPLFAEGMPLVKGVA